MRRSPLAAVLAAALLALSGCATAPAAEPTRTAESQPTPSPDPTPAVEALVVAPDEAPPAVFGGDCAAAVSAEVLSDALGTPITVVETDVEHGGSAVPNVGGIVCRWESGALYILPRAGLEQTRFPGEMADLYFQECGYECSWVWETDDLWIAGSADSVTGDRAAADAMAATIGGDIAGRWEADRDAEWTRDRTGWMAAPPCEAVGDAVGAQLGIPVTGLDWGTQDPQAPGYVMASAASEVWWCELQDADGMTFAYLHGLAGIGAAAPSDGDSVTADLGVPGIEAVNRGFGPLGGDMYVLTDGVNAVDLDARATKAGTPERVAAAVAAAMATAFE